ncbi:MAG: alkane 1-monooxygenase [Pseudomonadota bacterium]|nr:alkane 1-monooxygenase [Pseudomonadota bacterium]
MTEANVNEELSPALAYGLPLFFIPMMFVAWCFGGWTILIAPFFGYGLISLFDFILGERINSPKNDGKDLRRYKLILWIWPFLQVFLIFGGLITIFKFSDWSLFEQVALMLVQGMVTGAVGIVFAHELMHQKSFKERILADSLMGMALYGHFRTEHVLVHHRYVGTEKDAVTARFNEGFYKFLVRILPGCLLSAWKVESGRLLANGKSVFDKSNPFWIYVIFPSLYVLASYIIGGFWGIILFVIQAAVAVLHLEVVNYIEHYGLTRRKLSNGKIEQTKPHHSWNANHEASNFLLINLQKHSDHHVKPNRVYPLLKSYEASEAPQLPFGYPLMVLLSLFPVLWKSVMNPRVLEWRKRFYPDVTDWEDAVE